MTDLINTSRSPLAKNVQATSSTRFTTKNGIYVEKSKEQYSWIPPNLTPQKVQTYFKSIPEDRIPYIGSVGERHRASQLVQQLPVQDQEARFCRGLSDEEKRELRSFSVDRKKNSIGRGNVQIIQKTDNINCFKCNKSLKYGEAAVFASRAGDETCWHPSCFCCSICNEILVDLIYFYGPEIKDLRDTESNSLNTKNIDINLCNGGNSKLYNLKKFPTNSNIDGISENSNNAMLHLYSNLRNDDLNNFNFDENNFDLDYGDQIGDARRNNGSNNDIFNFNNKIDITKSELNYKNIIEDSKDNFWNENDNNNFKGRKKFNIFCGRHHAETIKPRCAVCDEIIFSDECTQAQGKSWHIRHFQCASCEKSLAGLSYIMYTGRPYCCDCYHANENACTTCKVKIEVGESHVFYGSRFWHARSECFFCEACRCSLVGKAFLPTLSHMVYCGGCVGTLKSIPVECAYVSENKQCIEGKNIYSNDNQKDYVSEYKSINCNHNRNLNFLNENSFKRNNSDSINRKNDEKNLDSIRSDEMLERLGSERSCKRYFEHSGSNNDFNRGRTIESNEHGFQNSSDEQNFNILNLNTGNSKHRNESLNDDGLEFANKFNMENIRKLERNRIYEENVGIKNQSIEHVNRTNYFSREYPDVRNYDAQQFEEMSGNYIDVPNNDEFNGSALTERDIHFYESKFKITSAENEHLHSRWQRNKASTLKTGARSKNLSVRFDPSTKPVSVTPSPRHGRRRVGGRRHKGGHCEKSTIKGRKKISGYSSDNQNFSSQHSYRHRSKHWSDLEDEFDNRKGYVSDENHGFHNYNHHSSNRSFQNDWEKCSTCSSSSNSSLVEDDDDFWASGPAHQIEMPLRRDLGTPFEWGTNSSWGPEIMRGEKKKRKSKKCIVS